MENRSMMELAIDRGSTFKVEPIRWDQWENWEAEIYDDYWHFVLRIQTTAYSYWEVVEQANSKIWELVRNRIHQEQIGESPKLKKRYL